MAPFLSWVPIATPSLRPWQGKEREEGLYSLSYCKVSDLLLTTFRFVLFCSFCLFSVGGGRVLLGTEKKKRDLYAVYKYICKVYSSFVQALAHCLFLPSLHLALAGGLKSQSSFLGTGSPSPRPPAQLGCVLRDGCFPPRRIQSMIPPAYDTALMIPRWS